MLLEYNIGTNAIKKIYIMCKKKKPITLLERIGYPSIFFFFFFIKKM